MALVARRAHDRRRAHALTGLALVGDGARIAVIAAAIVGLFGVRAGASDHVTSARGVALAERAAGHRVGADARARLTRILAGAGVRVFARGAVFDWLGLAGAGFRDADVGLAKVSAGRASDRRAEPTQHVVGAADLLAIAGVAVAAVGVGDATARRHVGRARAALFVTRVDRARQPVVAGHRLPAAHAGLAGVVAGAGLVVVTGHAVFGRDVTALARLRIAFAVDVAVVGGRARLRLVADAGARLARVDLGAGVVVVARLAVIDRLDRALVGHRIVDGFQARPQIVVALHHHAGTNSGQAAVLAGQRIVVIATVTVRQAAELALVGRARHGVANPERRGVAVVVGLAFDGAFPPVTGAASDQKTQRQGRKAARTHGSPKLAPPSP